MPKELEEKLKREAAKKADEKQLTGKAREEFINRYVYGTLQNTGWRRGRA